VSPESFTTTTKIHYPGLTVNLWALQETPVRLETYSNSWLRKHPPASRQPGAVGHASLPFISSPTVVSRKHGRQRGALGRRNYPQTSCAPVSSRSELNRGLAECWWTSFTSPVAFLCNSIMRLRMRILGKRLHSRPAWDIHLLVHTAYKHRPAFEDQKASPGLPPQTNTTQLTDVHRSSRPLQILGHHGRFRWGRATLPKKTNFLYVT